MPKPFLRCILGLAVALSCAAPAAAQQGPDPLTRFLDGIFKRPAAAPAQPQETAPAQQPAAPQAKTEAKKPAPKKTAAPKPQPAPQPELEPVTAAKPEPAQEQPQASPSEPEKKTAEPAASERAPTIEELSGQAAEEEARTEEPKVEEKSPVEVAEPPKPAKAIPAQAAPAPTSVAAPASPPTPVAPPLPSSPAAALERVNAYFNSIDRMSAYFVQKNPNGQQVEGTLSMQRPGRLHFAYAPPSTLEIVSDGRNVAIRDKQLGTNDVYPIGQTPLKFLLQENVDLARDVKLRDVQVGRDGMVTVRFDDSATLGGTSKITLRYDAKANALKQWTIVDAQGYETSVTLSGLNVVRQKEASASN